MKRLVVLGLVLLILPEGSELRAIESIEEGEDALKEGFLDKLDRLRQVENPKSWDRIPNMSKNYQEGDRLHVNVRKRRVPHDHHEHRNLVDNILEEIHKGHVTQEKMNHWWKEIQTALHDGEITMDDVHTLMEALKTTSKEHGEHCCWFG